MTYHKITFNSGVEAPYGYQEISDVDVRVTDDAGNTIDPATEMSYTITEPNCDVPAWGTP